MIFSQDILDNMEWYRNYTASNIDALQAGLVPAFFDFKWTLTDIYFYDSKYQVSRDLYEIVLSISGIRNNWLQNMPNVYKDTLLNAYNNKYAQAIGIFINKKFIKWSDVTIVRNYSKLYLIIDNFDRDIKVENFDIMYIPGHISYVEDGSFSIGSKILFRFNDQGLEDSTGNYILGSLNPKLVIGNYNSQTELEKYYLSIDRSIKLTNTNVLIFKNGLLERNIKPEIQNLNLITIKDTNIFFRVFYHTESNPNKSNIALIPNDTYLRSIETGLNVSDTIKTDILRKDFDMSFSKDITYEANSTNAINTIFKNNQGMMDDVHLKRLNKKYGYTQITGAQLKTHIKDGILVMPLYKYEDYKYDTRCLMFINGELYNKYDQITYGISNLITPMAVTDIQDTDIIEFMHFKKVNNTIIEANISGGEEVTDYIKEMKILSTYDEVNSIDTSVYHNTKFTFENNTIIFDNPYHYDKPVIIASANQFRQYRLIPTNDITEFDLPLEFRTCLDTNKYMLFVNRRLVNRNNYKLSIDQVSYTDMKLYSGSTIKASDIIDLFYIPTDANYIHPGFELMLDQVNVYADVDDQSEFEIPYPYTRYLKDKTGFMIYKGTTFIHPDRYNILSKKKIQFIDPEDYVDSGRYITFVFLYNLFKGEYAEISSRSQISIITKQITVTESTNQVVLPIHGVSDGFILSVNSVFLDQARYTIDTTGPDYILTFTDPEDILDPNMNVNFIYAFSNFENRYIGIKVLIHEATVNATSTFPLPTKYTDNFLVSFNSTFVDNERYNIQNGNLVLTDPEDYLDQGERLTFIYFPEYTDENGEIRHCKMYMTEFFSEDDSQVSFEMPFFYDGCIFGYDSFMVMVASLFVDPQRYTIDNTNYQLKFTDTYDAIPKGLQISYIYGASLLVVDDLYDDSIERDSVQFETIELPVTVDGQVDFNVPELKRNKYAECFITIGSTLLDIETYDYNNETRLLKLANEVGIRLKAGINSVFVTFIKNDFIVIHKKVVKIPVTSNGQRAFTLPTFDDYPNTKFRQLIFVGSTYVQPDRFYRANGGRIILNNNDIYMQLGGELTVMFLYLGEDTRRPRWLPESGYLYIDRHEAIHNLNRNLYSIFINGKKIDYNNIIDLCDNLVRMKTNTRTRYNVSMITFLDQIQEFKELKYVKSDWSNALDYMTAEDLDILWKVSTVMTDEEPHRPVTIVEKQK